MVSVGVYAGIGVLVALAMVLAAAYLRARRRGIQQGVTRIVRCSEGHLFTSTVVPGASFKAVRLGPAGTSTVPWAVTGALSDRWTLQL